MIFLDFRSFLFHRRTDLLIDSRPAPTLSDEEDLVLISPGLLIVQLSLFDSQNEQARKGAGDRLSCFLSLFKAPYLLTESGFIYQSLILF